MYCDGDLVIVSLTNLVSQHHSEPIIEGLVPLVVQDGLQKWKDPDGSKTVEGRCDRLQI